MVLSLAVIFFVLGSIIGSFLNVVIYRINTKRSLGGRSACMSCQNKLTFFELIPIVSFLGLGGRCRSCKTKISIQYPLVEFVTAVIFAFLFFKLYPAGGFAFGGEELLTFAITYIYYAAMFSILVVIATYDLKHKIIPDTLAFIFGALAFIGLFFFVSDTISGVSNFSTHVPSMLQILSGILMALPFAFFWLISNGKWMGFGDAKLTLGLGWLLGIQNALSALVIAFWSGAIVGVILIIISKINKGRGGMGMKSEIPFAPFLVLGAILAFIFKLNFFNF